MIVVMHRPPLRRIDFGLKPRAVDPPTVNLNCLAEFQEQNRIWALLQQSARGCNSVGGER